MKFIEVKEKAEKKEFNDFAARLYKNEKNWIRPLDKDIEAVFDPNKNPLFAQGGEIIRWLLKDENDSTVGRIAAFVNPKTVHTDNDQPTGGAGFFECVKDEKVAFALFEKAKGWLESKGMEAMDAPINFGERNQWWGLLVDGFDKEPNYQMFYHFPYYQGFFEKWGFQEYFKQFTYGRGISEMSPRLERIAARVMQKEGYEFRHIDKKRLPEHAEEFREIYNAGWATHHGVAQISSQEAKALLKQMKPVIEEDLIWFAYNHGKPVGFWVMLPELNQLFKHLNGKFRLWQKLQFLWYKRQKKNTKVFGVIYGVVPEVQGRGIELGLITAYAKERERQVNHQYKTIEFNWIGDFNTAMVKLSQNLDAEVVKTHITYRYLFDRQKPFKRMPAIKK